MPLVRMHKARQGFRRNKTLKGRPEWQDILPTTPQGRKAYAIADRYQSRFSRVFMDAVREVLEDPKILTEFKAAWKTGSVVAVMDTLPFFQEGATDDLPVWKRFMGRMESAYTDVIQEAGTAATRDMNRDLGTNLKFTVIDTPVEDETVVLKADGDAPKPKRKKPRKRPIPPLPTPMGPVDDFGIDVMPGTFAGTPAAAAGVAVVPINPYSKAWMRTRSLGLVTEGITGPQRKVVQDILFETLSSGVRAESAYSTIRDNIGLTQREYGAVANRRALMEAAGFPKDKIDAAAGKYTQKLTRKRAERIARTETIRAQAQGRADSWKVARDSGVLPQVVRKWISTPPSPNPGRPCEVCLDLDGKTAGLDEPYDSLFLGTVEGPPAHPNCLPGDTLITARGVTAVSRRWYNGDVVVFRTARGYSFTCTPNHPILTDTGWVGAATLAVGDHVISDRGFERISAPLIDHNHENVPTVVDTVANLFDRLSFSESIPVPGTTKDFHGDGTNGDITIIRTDSLLGDTVGALSTEEGSEGSFLFCALRQASLTTLCSAAQFFKRCFTPSNRFMCRVRKTLFFRFICLGHSKKHSFTTVAGGDAGFEEQSSNDVAADAPGFGKMLLAHSPKIVRDYIVDVCIQSFSGHVYNLQTVEGYYIAQSVYTHNCRCTETMVRKKGKE